MRTDSSSLSLLLPALRLNPSRFVSARLPVPSAVPSFVQLAEPDGGEEEMMERVEEVRKGRRGEEAEIEGTSAVGAQSCASP